MTGGRGDAGSLGIARRAVFRFGPTTASVASEVTSSRDRISGTNGDAIAVMTAGGTWTKGAAVTGVVFVTGVVAATGVVVVTGVLAATGTSIWTGTPTAGSIARSASAGSNGVGDT